MSPLRRRVEKGRLVLDDDEGDELSDAERKVLHQALATSAASTAAGRFRAASSLIDDLRRR